MSEAHTQTHVTDVDPFELPDWLGTGEVVWTASDGVRGSGLISGTLCPRPTTDSTDTPVDEIACDLLSVDAAYPAPVADPDTRQVAHRAWHNQQVHLVEREGRVTLLVPGAWFDADLVLEALARLARAVGARPERYVAALRIGARSNR